MTRALAADGYHVRALTRSPKSEKTLSKLKGIAHVEPFFFDVEDTPSVVAAFKGVKVVYALSNPDLVAVLEPPGSTVRSIKLNEFEQGKVMADVAKDEGVEIFIWRALLTTQNSTRDYLT